MSSEECAKTSSSRLCSRPHPAGARRMRRELLFPGYHRFKLGLLSRETVVGGADGVRYMWGGLTRRAKYLAGVHGVQEVVNFVMPVHLREVDGGGRASRADVVKEFNHLQVPVPSRALHRFPRAALRPDSRNINIITDRYGLPGLVEVLV